MLKNIKGKISQTIFIVQLVSLVTSMKNSVKVFPTINNAELTGYKVEVAHFSEEQPQNPGSISNSDQVVDLSAKYSKYESFQLGIGDKLTLKIGHKMSSKGLIIYRDFNNSNFQDNMVEQVEYDERSFDWSLGIAVQEKKNLKIPIFITGDEGYIAAFKNKFAGKIARLIGFECVTDPEETVDILKDYPICDECPPNYVTVHNFEGYTFVFISIYQIRKPYLLDLFKAEYEPIFKIPEISVEDVAETTTDNLVNIYRSIDYYENKIDTILEETETMVTKALTEFQNENGKFDEGSVMKLLKIYEKVLNKNTEIEKKIEKTRKPLDDKPGDNANTKIKNFRERISLVAEINAAKEEVAKIKENLFSIINDNFIGFWKIYDQIAAEQKRKWEMTEISLEYIINSLNTKMILYLEISENKPEDVVIRRVFDLLVNGLGYLKPDFNTDFFNYVDITYDDDDDQPQMDVSGQNEVNIVNNLDIGMNDSNYAGDQPQNMIKSSILNSSSLKDTMGDLVGDRLLAGKPCSLYD